MKGSEAPSEALRRRGQRLVNECVELGDDPYGWTLHLTIGLRRLVGFQVATFGMSTTLPWLAGPTDFLELMDHGWANADQRRRFLDYWQSGLMPSDPTATPFRRLRGRVLARRREDICTDRDWCGSMHYNDYYRPADIEHVLPSSLVPEGISGIGGFFFTALRERSDGPFNPRDVRLIAHVLSAVRAHLGFTLRPFGTTTPDDPTPRQRMVLALLVRGLSEAEIAHQLALSPHTVRQHIKGLYQHLGVGSRLDLQAAYARAKQLPSPMNRGLPRRLGEVLERLGQGLSETDIAADLGLSPHTVHEYVTALCRRFDVCGRGELLFAARLARAEHRPS